VAAGLGRPEAARGAGVREPGTGGVCLGRVLMFGHKFTVGQSVRFSPDRVQASTSRGGFKIVRLLPETANVLQYRVKNQIDGHERVVREDQLAPS